MKKRIISLFLMLCMILSLVPVGAFAVEDEEQTTEVQTGTSQEDQAATTSEAQSDGQAEEQTGGTEAGTTLPSDGDQSDGKMDNQVAPDGEKQANSKAEEDTGTKGSTVTLSGVASPSGTIVDSGYCGGEGDGTNLSWTLYSNNVLVISGEGEMKKYWADAPWREYGAQVKDVIIEEGVTSLAQHAFNFSYTTLDTLSNIELPESLETIGNGALGSSHLKEIYIPKNVSMIEGGALYGVNLIVTIDEDNWFYTVKDGAVLSKDESTLIQAPSLRYFYLNGSNSTDNVYTIPDGVCAIASRAFEGCQWFSAITIPESVKFIGEYAFYAVGHEEYNNPAHDRKVKITLPDYLEFVGKDAFTIPSWGNDYVSSGITNMVKYKNGYYLGNDSNPYLLYLGMDTSDSSAKKLVIHDNTKLAMYSPETSENVTGINIYGTEEQFCDIVSQWGYYSPYKAFFLIGNDGSVKKAVTGLGYYEQMPLYFDPDTGCIVPLFDLGMDGYHGKEIIWQVNMESDTLEISGNGIMDINSRVLDNGEIQYLPGPWSEIKYMYWTEIDGERQYFESNSQIQILIINEGINHISPAAFKGMYLTSVSLPDSLWYIGESAFYDNNRLPSITIPKGVQYIDNNAFENNSSLSKVTLSEGIEYIGDSAFQSCGILQSIELPNSLRTIGDYAFAYCRSLKTVTLGTDLDDIGEKVFDQSPINTVTFTYTNTGARTVPSGLFTRSETIRTINIPEGIQSIAKEAFSNCSALESIVLPNSITNIGDHAFYWCSKLKNVQMGTNVASEYGYTNSPFYLSPVSTVSFTCDQSGLGKIPAGLFGHDDDLRTINMPEGVKLIGAMAFSECNSLEEIVLPNSIVGIGNGAFSSCSKLSKVTISVSLDDDNNGGTSDEYGQGESIDVGPIVVVHSANSDNSSVSLQDGYIVRPLPDPGPIKVSFDTHYRFKESPVTTVILKAGASQSVVPEYFMDKVFGRENAVSKIIVSPGIRRIEQYAFYNCENLKLIYLPKSVEFVSTKCLDNDWASNVDIYYGGSRTSWNLMHMFGDNVSDPLFKARVHCGYDTDTYSGSVIGSTTSHTASNHTTVQFDAGEALYKNGKTRTELDISWNGQMFGIDASAYSKDIAIASLVLSSNAYNKGLVKETLISLGFSDPVQYRYEIGEENGDPSDTIGFTIAHRTMAINGQRTNVIVVVCRGTAGEPLLSREWRSNIEHMSDGFNTAASDVESILRPYISNNIEHGYPTILWITGHSRGGAVANLLGKRMSDFYQKKNVFVYTFACPTTTNSEDRFEYTNIKNFVNKQDAIPALPGLLNNMVTGYNRYGIDYSFDKSDASSFDSCLSDLTGGSVSLDVDNPIKEHCQAVYMAYIMASERMSVNSKYKAKVIAVKCPVDVDVYDSHDRLIGSIRNNQPDDSLQSNGVFVVIDGDEKYLYATSGLDLRLELTGTSTGTMTYSVEEFDMTSGTTAGTQTFTGVTLTEGKKMISDVASDIAVPDTQLFVLSNDEVTSEVSTNGSEQEVVLLSFDTDLGDPIRSISVPKGEAAGELPKAHMDGYKFDGWYKDATLLQPFDQTASLTSSETLYAKYSEAYDVYGEFSGISYDGNAVTATLEYDYNKTNSKLFVALYQDEQMVAVTSAEVSESDATTTVTLPISNLFGVYHLKAFFLGDDGKFAPINCGTEVSFYAN